MHHDIKVCFENCILNMHSGKWEGEDRVGREEGERKRKGKEGGGGVYL